MCPILRKIRRSGVSVTTGSCLLLLCLLSLTSCRHISRVTTQDVAGATEVIAASNRAACVPVTIDEPPDVVPLIARTGDSTPLATSTDEIDLTEETAAATAVQSSDLQLVDWSDEEIEAEPNREVQVQPPAVLTLDELVAIAIQNNPTIPQAAATAYKAMGVRKQVGLYPNPTIGYTGQEIGNNGTAGGQGGFINQTIVLGDKLGWNRAVLDQEVQSQLWQVESQRYRVRNDVRRQFFETLGAQERLKIAAELVRIAEDGLENAEALQKAQQAALPDVLQARVQLQEVQVIQKNASYTYDASWKRLDALVGLPYLEPVELQPILFDEQLMRDRDTAWAQIVSLSPQLQQARAEVQRARARIGRERVEPIPNLQVQVAAMHMNDSDDNVANVMVGVPIPLFNANQGNKERAAADYHRACQNVRRLELLLQSQLAIAFRDYQDARNRVVTYREEIVPAQSETLELIEQAYPLQFEFLRLLTARRMYYEARLEYLEAAIDLRQSEVLLDGLLLRGGLNDVPDTSFDDGLRGQALSGQ